MQLILILNFIKSVKWNRVIFSAWLFYVLFILCFYFIFFVYLLCMCIYLSHLMCFFIVSKLIVSPFVFFVDVILDKSNKWFFYISFDTFWIQIQYQNPLSIINSNITPMLYWSKTQKTQYSLHLDLGKQRHIKRTLSAM